MGPDLKQLLSLAVSAAEKAGTEILKVYGSDFTVERKEDKTPLTLADKNSHAVIEETLSRTGIPVLSEEGKDIPYSERKDWKHLWIVDPLDGTKEFVKRNGEFTVNIALIEDQRPVLGVIYSPVTKNMYYAAKGLGAFRKVNNKEEKLPLARKHTKFTVVASRSHMSSETYAYIEELKKRHGDIELISTGSSVKICLVAEGSADCYPRFGPTMEWDTASGQAIAECAGKEFIDISTGKPMTYNRENLLNNSFVVR